MNIHIRSLEEADAARISRAFLEQGWNKTSELYERYAAEQREGARVTLIAEADGAFAGYINVLWESDYPAFRAAGIPEISDLNVLVKFQRLGMASKLMDHAEQAIAERSTEAGIGVGLFSDYGPAQVLYARRGYIPDGRGLYKEGKYSRYGDTEVIDDDLVLYLTKRLR
ncbi:GNAT family N-acetyltransferase [Saccharibacillus qingshengii]|uniref:GNAT family N-acetyltransferase n=1 Tax=Saccharibacillus qingshengii TaxID=1763540 RepID=UPI0015521F19|nr:GNAT family N-acetyltransferase [Saccharibacillus qingshengii]